MNNDFTIELNKLIEETKAYKLDGKFYGTKAEAIEDFKTTEMRKLMYEILKGINLNVTFGYNRDWIINEITERLKKQMGYIAALHELEEVK